MKRVRSMKLPSAIIMAVIITLLAASLSSSATTAHAASLQTQHSYLSSSSSNTDLAKYVDPFTGTSTQPGASFGGGDTFPGADVPFGMVQWSPDTSVSRLVS